MWLTSCCNAQAFMFTAVKKYSTKCYWNLEPQQNFKNFNFFCPKERSSWLCSKSDQENVPRGFAPNQRTVLISSLKSNFIRLHSLIIANPMRHDDNYYKHDGTHRKLDKLRVYVISVRFNICRIHGVLIFSNHP